MKKLLFAVALLAILAGCSQNETVSVPETNYINFASSFVDNVTRADITKGNLTEFDVWGHAGSEVLFDGVKVYKDAGVWTYDDKKEWGAGKTYHFHAFAPTGVLQSDDLGTYPYVGRTRGLGDVIYTNTGDKDLIYAYNTYKQGLIVSDYTVKFTFSHLLSRVKFTFENHTDAEIEVSTIKITNAVKQATLRTTEANIGNWVWDSSELGDFNFGSIGTIAKAVSATEPGKAEISQPLYMIPSAKRDYNVTFNLGGTLKAVTLKDVEFSLGGSYNIIIKITDTAAKYIEFDVENVGEWDSYLNVQ